jgi:hypothetical protein
LPVGWEVRAVADFSGDGKPDVLWRRASTGEDVIWVIDGAVITSAAALPAIPNASCDIRGSGDLNGDGRSDLVWRNAVTGANIVWLMNGVTLAGAAFITTLADINWELNGVGDFDGNGKADLIWRNKVSGQNVAWLMDGLTTVAATNAGHGRDPPGREAILRPPDDRAVYTPAARRPPQKPFNSLPWSLPGREQDGRARP